MEYNWEYKILARCSFWDWRNSKCINVLDNKGNITQLLNEWETLVFHEANGNNTIRDVIDMYPTMYLKKEMMPKEYENEIIVAAKKIIQHFKLVELWDTKNDLVYYFDVPQGKQDKIEAKRLMEEDGLFL